MEDSCPAGCGYKGPRLEMHFNFSPNCKPAAPEVQKKRKVRDPLASATL